MSTNIKKDFVELFNFLEANQGKKVSTIMAELTEMMSRKSGGGGNFKTFIKDEQGNVTHVYCYYHNKWEDVTECEYGVKKHSASGLNTMCKEGVSMWTKQQRVKKQETAELLARVASGEVKPEDIAAEQELIAERANEIVPRADGKGSDVAPNS